MTGGRFVSDGERVLYHVNVEEVKGWLDKGAEPPAMETAGPRETLYFDPSTLACGIVTCGGLCPGLNDVIRSIVLSLYHHYGVTKIYGFRYGYEGLVRRLGHAAPRTGARRRSTAFTSRADPFWVLRAGRRTPRRWCRRSRS